MAIQQKLNIYKFVKAPNISADAVRDAGPLGKGLVQSQSAQLKSLNSIGNALNSIGASLKGLYGVELNRLKKEKKEARQNFTPDYTKAQGLQTKSLKSPFKGLPINGVWEGLLGILGGL